MVVLAQDIKMGMNLRLGCLVDNMYNLPKEIGQIIQIVNTGAATSHGMQRASTLALGTPEVEEVDEGKEAERVDEAEQTKQATRAPSSYLMAGVGILLAGMLQVGKGQTVGATVQINIEYKNCT